MTHARTTAESGADNNDLTSADLAAVVEALTGEPLDHTDSVVPRRARRRVVPRSSPSQVDAGTKLDDQPPDTGQVMFDGYRHFSPDTRSSPAARSTK